jgi:hypothetical protein
MEPELFSTVLASIKWFGGPSHGTISFAVATWCAAANSFSDLDYRGSSLRSRKRNHIG